MNASQRYRKKNPLLTVWEGMKRRCYNSNEPAYKNYGARGIKVCEQWQSYRGFLRDMGSSYRRGLTLDRIDNDGDYTPENCRWANKVMQANNTRTNRYITIDGVTRTLANWCKMSDVKPSTVRQRFYVYGWPIKRSLGFGG